MTRWTMAFAVPLSPCCGARVAGGGEGAEGVSEDGRLVLAPLVGSSGCPAPPVGSQEPRSMAPGAVGPGSKRGEGDQTVSNSSTPGVRVV
jgi:hypothetical protein